MIDIIRHIVGFGCLAFSIIGFIETLLSLAVTKTYNLLRAIIYSVLFGIALGLM